MPLQKLIFPGVGAFKSAIDHLKSRGLLGPLKAYIESGRPYFGICIGLQVLFESSAENPGSQGLGVIPAPIEAFDNSSKAVPHIGWNAAELLHSSSGNGNAALMPDGEHFYFVHSFRAAYDPADTRAAAWVHATTQYGREVFVASVRRGSVFGTQFHPEKSGAAGLRLLRAWLEQPRATFELKRPSAPIVREPKERDGLTKRVIACMDVRANDDGDLVVTKGDQYDVREKAPAAPVEATEADASAGPSTTSLQAKTGGAVRNLGKPVALAARYTAAGADELCLLNITSFRHSPLQDQPMLAVVRAAAENVFVPLTIGGGIKDTVEPDGTVRPALEVAGAYFRAGADKVSIGSEAVFAVERLREKGRGDRTSPMETIAEAYGRQAVVVSIDPKRVYVDPATYEGPYKSELVYGKGEEEGKAWWYQCTVSGGRQTRDLSAVQLAQGAEKLGAGELLLNSIDRDGTGKGFDLDLIRLVRNAVSIPVVASSGAGSAAHFKEVFEETGVEAALAAGIFHREEVKIEEVKEVMKSAGLNVRLNP